MVNNEHFECAIMIVPSECIDPFFFGPTETPVLFYAMRPYYRDDTANIAIAHVMREQKKKEKKPPEPKPERKKEPGPPVDVWKILQSEHKIIHINKAEWMYRRMLKSIEENKEDDR